VRDGSILKNVNPVVSFIAVVALVLGITVLTLRFVESRNTKTAQNPAQQQAPAQQQPSTQEEKPAEASPTPDVAVVDQKQSETPVQQPSATQGNQKSESSTASPVPSTSLPTTGVSVSGFVTFLMGIGVTTYLLLTLRRQRLALRP
jgi:outer membrane biosynthesis protein TonB